MSSLASSRSIIHKKKKIFYFEAGPAAGRTLVFVHGFTGSHLGIKDLALSFSDQYRVVIFDMPGCGYSEKLDAPHTLAEFAQFLDYARSALGLERATFIGHCYGGMLCTYYFARYGVKNDLILLAPFPEFKPELRNYLVSAFYGVAGVLPEKTANKLLRSRHVSQRVFEMLLRSGDDGARQTAIAAAKSERQFYQRDIILQTFNDFKKLKNLDQIAAGVKAKVLLVVGGKDMLARPDKIMESYGVITNKQVVTLGYAGHIMQIENVAELHQIMTDWLEAARSKKAKKSRGEK